MKFLFVLFFVFFSIPTIFGQDSIEPLTGRGLFRATKEPKDKGTRNHNDCTTVEFDETSGKGVVYFSLLTSPQYHPCNLVVSISDLSLNAFWEQRKPYPIISLNVEAIIIKDDTLGTNHIEYVYEYPFLFPTECTDDFPVIFTLGCEDTNSFVTDPCHSINQSEDGWLDQEIYDCDFSTEMLICCPNKITENIIDTTENRSALNKNDITYKGSKMDVILLKIEGAGMDIKNVYLFDAFGNVLNYEEFMVEDGELKIKTFQDIKGVFFVSVMTHDEVKTVKVFR